MWYAHYYSYAKFHGKNLSKFSRVLLLLLTGFNASSASADGFFATKAEAYAACKNEQARRVVAEYPYFTYSNSMCAVDWNPQAIILWYYVNHFYWFGSGCPSGQTPLNIPPYTCQVTPTCDVNTKKCAETNLNPIKNNAEPPAGLCSGNPINTGTGNKYQLESDYQGAGNFPLNFRRFYNSNSSTYSNALGYGSGWRHSYERSISSISSSGSAIIYRANGVAYTFTLVGTEWLPVADVNLTLTSTIDPVGWQLTTEDGSVEAYNASGQLLSIKSLAGVTHKLSYDTNGYLKTVTHTNGHSLNFTYDRANRIATLKDPAGGIYTYSYDSAGNLVSVTYPDHTTRTYLYNEAGNVAVSLPHALTGLIDENHNRFASWTYDSQGRAISSQHAGGVEYVGVNYGTNSGTVTDALNTARTNSLRIVQGVVKSGGQSQPAGAGCSAAASNLSYDANGNVSSRTDFNGNLSCFAYDLARNLETARVEGLAPGKSCPSNLATYIPAANSSERLTTTQWHAGYRLPIQIDQAGLSQSFSYDAAGNLLQKTITDTATQQSRTWAYTYNSNGQILSEDGPRTDVNDITSYSYYSDSTATHNPGDLWTRTDALGHVTTYTAYNAHGQLLSLTDANGLTTTLAYDARQRLTSVDAGGETTTYTYDPSGQLTRITRPDGSYLAYSYDAAHRLIQTQDNLGNTVTYTLDALGNRIQEEAHDPSGQLARSQSRVYDALSRLQNLIQPQ
jgi:YD repeat-containing protein